MATIERDMIEIRNVKHPDSVHRVDAAKYTAMKRAYLKVLPRTAPGLTPAAIRAGLIAHLPETLFPGGAKAGWWAKAVQLDLEAKGVVVRESEKPVRLRRA